MAKELIAIELQLKGYEGVMSDMKMLDQMLNNLRGRKNRLTIESNLSQAKKEVIAYEAEVRKCREELEKTQKYISGTKIKTEEWTKANKALEKAKENLSTARQKVKELSYALRELGSASFIQTFNKISSAVAHIGSAMQSAGNALTRLTSPFRRFTTGLLMGAGYKALNMITSGFSGAFERYDTMQNYAKSLEALGLDATQKFAIGAGEAKTAIDNLNDSVLGLPTGLDEIVAAQKVYAGATGEMVESTKIAIAANNAFLASGMDSRSQRYMQRYLASLASGAALTTTQWQSMGRNAPQVMRAVSEELGYASDDYDKFTSAVQKGKISGQEFLDAFIKVGTEGKVQAAANVMKTTWEGLSANIQNATKRMGEGILKSLDTVFETYNGRNLVQNLLGFDAEGNEVGGGIKHFINDISDSVQEWIKAHPDEIIDFINSIKSVDWKGFLSGLAEGMLEIGKLAKIFADFMSDKDMAKLGKWAIRGNLLGSALTIAGGLLKGSRHIIGGIGAGIIEVIRFAGRAKTFGGIGGLLKTILVGTNAAQGEQAVETVGKVTPKMSKFSSGLSSFFKGWAEIAIMVGGTALTAWGTMKLVKGTITTFGEIIDIVKSIDWATGADVFGYMLTFFGVFAAVSKIMGDFAGEGVTLLIGEAIVGLFTTLASGFAAIDMLLIKTAFKNFNDATVYMKEGLERLDDIPDIENSTAFKEKISNAIEAFNAITKLFKGDWDDSSHQWQNGMLQFDKSYADSIGNIRDSLVNIKEAVDVINKLNKVKLKDDNIEDLTQRIGTSMSFIAEMYNKLPQSMKGGEAVETSSNMTTSLANFKTALDSIIGKKGILSKIPEITSIMANLIRGSRLTKFEEYMESLGNTLTTVYTSLQGIGNGKYFAENLDGFRAGLKSFKGAIKHLEAINDVEIDEGIVTKVKTIIQNIEDSFDAGQVDRIKENINTLTSSLKEALSSFEEFNVDVEIGGQVNLSQKFYSSTSKAVKDINTAAAQVRTAWSGIPSSLTKTINARVSANVDVSGAVKSINEGAARVKAIADQAVAGYISTGGRVSRQGILYRSGGGSVFKPRGTDKIPAMLTEGEYVHRKQATDFWGLDFMRKINAMDVRGAMQGLMAKAGSATNIGRQSIIHNTVNNNQKVVQNINTNNPNFAGIQMGRFVGAL